METADPTVLTVTSATEAAATESSTVATSGTGGTTATIVTTSTAPATTVASTSAAPTTAAPTTAAPTTAAPTTAAPTPTVTSTSAVPTSTVAVTSTPPSSSQPDDSDSGGTGSGATSGGAPYPFDTTDPNLRDCLLRGFGADLFGELTSGRRPSAAEAEVIGSCLAVGRSSDGGPLPAPDDPPRPAPDEGSDRQDDDESAAPSAAVCPTDQGPVSGLGWITEVNRLMDAVALGHSPVPGVLDQSIGASDPRVVQLADGSYRIYFAASPDGLTVARSDDGVDWELEARSVIPSGMPHTSLVSLADGGWRLFAVRNAPGATVVKSFASADGIGFVEEPGDRLANGDFPFGNIQSPFVFEMPDGTYRMYLLAYPQGEEAAQPSGYSVLRMVSATSNDMLVWTADPGVVVEGLVHPSATVSVDGTITVYAGAPLTRIVSTDGRDFSEAEYLDLSGRDFDVKPATDGQLRVYSNGHDFDEGSWLRVSRSTTVTWDAEISVRGYDSITDVFTLDVCVTGSSATPIEIHLTDKDHRVRNLDLESNSVSVVWGIPPFRTTVTFDNGSVAGGPYDWRPTKSLLRLSDGVAIREWAIDEVFTDPFLALAR